MKELDLDLEVEYVRLSSYEGTKSSGNVIEVLGISRDISNRDIIIVEDIVDTGKTLHHFLPSLQQQQPASIRIATFLHKPEATLFKVPLDYIGFSIPNKFVVGYGLDYDGRGRNYGALYQVL